jgi:hypothetical protein
LQRDGHSRIGLPVAGPNDSRVDLENDLLADCGLIALDDPPVNPVENLLDRRKVACDCLLYQPVGDQVQALGRPAVGVESLAMQSHAEGVGH